MRTITLRIAALAFATAIAFDAAAQTDIDEPAKTVADSGSAKTLGTVRVSGRYARGRTAEGPDAARERLDQRAGATALVDGESYRDRRVGTLTDALG